LTAGAITVAQNKGGSKVDSRTDGKLLGCQNISARETIGEAHTSDVLSDILLFFCLAAFVTGILIAAANLLLT